MKNRGKNKKKQWKRILKNIGDELHDAAKTKDLIADGFVLQKKTVVPLKKGRKELAKDHPDIPTSKAALTKSAYRPGKKSVFTKCIDLWASENDKSEKDMTQKSSSTGATVEKQNSTLETPNLIVPAGQSYNPSAVDHQALLLHVAKEEEKAEAASDPLVAKRAKKTKKRKLTQAQLEALRLKAKMAGRKPTREQLAKQMHTDLENIPKLLKEIRREKQAHEERRKKREAMEAIRQHEKAPKFPTAFQLPGELAPNLRKLRMAENFMREVEFKRNKLPRARKTLDKKAAVTKFERRSRQT